MINKKYYYGLYGLVLLGLIALIIFLESVNLDLRHTIIKEGGPIESLSAIGYFICVILLFFTGKEYRGCLYTIFILFVFGLRELDFHARFTTISLSKIKFYVSPDVPVMEKVIGATFILLLLYSIIRLVKIHFGDFIIAIKQMEPHSIGVFFGILFLFFAKTLDGFARKFASIGVTIGSEASQITTAIEEVLELGIPLMFIIAIVAKR